jgi:hypothetical protein
MTMEHKRKPGVTSSSELTEGVLIKADLQIAGVVEQVKEGVPVVSVAPYPGNGVFKGSSKHSAGASSTASQGNSPNS